MYVPGFGVVNSHTFFSPLPPGAVWPTTPDTCGPMRLAKARSRLPVTKMNILSLGLGSIGTKSIRSSPSQPQTGLTLLAPSTAEAGLGATRAPRAVGIATGCGMPEAGRGAPVGGGKAATSGNPVMGLIVKRGVSGVGVRVAVTVGVTVDVEVGKGGTGVEVGSMAGVGVRVGVGVTSPAGGANSRHAAPRKASKLTAAASPTVLGKIPLVKKDLTWSDKRFCTCSIVITSTASAKQMCSLS